MEQADTSAEPEARGGDWLALLERVIAVASGAQHLERGLEDVLAATMDALEYEAGAVILFEEDDESGRLVCRRGLPDDAGAQFAQLDHAGPARRAAAAGGPLVSDREAGDAVPGGFACAITVPLGAADAVSGELTLFSRRSHTPAPDLMAVLMAVGGEAGELVARASVEAQVRLLTGRLEAVDAERASALEVANQALRAEVDKRRRARDELRDSEERYRRLFDLGPDALLLVDVEELTILDANEAATRMYGRPREGLLGLPLKELSAHPDAAREAVALTAGAPHTHVSLQRHRHASGVEFPVEITSGAFTLRGRRLATQAVRDVTERERRQAYTEAVGEIQRKLLGADENTTPVALYDLVLPELLQASGADRVYVFENCADESGRLLGFQRAELVRPGISAQLHNPVLQGHPWEAMGPEWTTRLAAGAPVLGRPAEFNDYARRLLEAQAVSSVLSLPLTVHDGLFGVIGFDNCSDERTWGFSEVALLTTAAAALSGAVERHLAFHALRHRTAELGALLHTSGTIASSIDFDEVLREVARVAGEALSSPECVIWEYAVRNERAEFRCLWERDPKPGLAASLEGASYDITTHAGGLEALRAAEVVQQSRSDPELPEWDRADMDLFGEKTWLTIPLVAAAELIGVMILVESIAERDFTTEERRLAAAIGGQAAVALSNARQHRREAERIVWLQALVEAGRAVTSTLDIDELLPTVAKLAAQAVRSPIAFIYEYDRDRDAIVTRTRFGPEGLGRVDPVGTVFAVQNAPDDRRALVEGKVFVETVSDRKLHRYVRESMEATGEKTLVNVPFRFQGEALGMLVLVETERERVFTEDELSFLEAFGEQVAIAFSNARLYATIEAQATADGLTGLANHRSFYDHLGQELTRAQRYGTPVSLLMIDIDDFKLLNDTWGHQAGDEVLRELGRILAEQLRQDVDVPARYGGEEFAVILPNTGVLRGARYGAQDPDAASGHGEGAEALGERLRSLIAGTAFRVGDDQTAHLTVSIGVATYPEMARDMDDLVAHADAALYAAKRTGKDLVQVYRR
jgi:PAS domain S-box-containing protein